MLQLPSQQQVVAVYDSDNSVENNVDLNFSDELMVQAPNPLYKENDYVSLNAGRHYCLVPVDGLQVCSRSYQNKKSWKRHMKHDHFDIFIQVFGLKKERQRGSRKWKNRSSTASEGRSSPQTAMVQPTIASSNDSTPQFMIDCSMPTMVPQQSRTSLQVQQPMAIQQQQNNLRLPQSPISSRPQQSSLVRYEHGILKVHMTGQDLKREVIKDVVTNFTHPKCYLQQAQIKSQFANYLQVFLDEDYIRSYLKQHRSEQEEGLKCMVQGKSVYVKMAVCSRSGLTLVAVHLSFLTDDYKIKTVLLDVVPVDGNRLAISEEIFYRINIAMTQINCVVIDRYHDVISTASAYNDSNFRRDHARNLDAETEACRAIVEFYESSNIPCIVTATIAASTALESALKNADVVKQMEFIEQAWVKWKGDNTKASGNHDDDKALTLLAIMRKIWSMNKNLEKMASVFEDADEAKKLKTHIDDIMQVYKHLDKFHKTQREAKLRPGNYFLSWNRLLFCCNEAKGVLGQALAKQLLENEETFLYDKHLLAAAYFDKVGRNAIDIRDYDECSLPCIREHARKAAVQTVKVLTNMHLSEVKLFPPEVEVADHMADDLFDRKLAIIKRRKVEESSMPDNVIQKALDSLESFKYEHDDIVDDIAAYPHSLRDAALMVTCMPCGRDRVDQLYATMGRMPRDVEDFEDDNLISDMLFIRSSFDAEHF